MRSGFMAAGCAAALGVGGVLAAYTSAGAAPSTGPSSGSSVSMDSEHRAQGEGTDTAGEHQRPAHAQKMVEIAHTHRDAMHQWQSCMRATAKPGASRPASACEKPLPPGWVKHPDQHPGVRPGDKRQDERPDKGSSEQD